MSNAYEWIKEAAEQIVIEWPSIDAEAGQTAQQEQDSYAGHAVSVKAVGDLIEQHWERSIADATPVDMGNLLDQAQEEIRRLKADKQRWRDEINAALMLMRDGVVVGTARRLEMLLGET